MIRRTLAQLKPPTRRVALVSGLSATDERILDRINLAIEELMTEGDWPGVVDRYQFSFTPQNQNHIFLPFFLERAMGITFDGLADSFRSPWYEFVAAGPGPSLGCRWLSGVIDRDDTSIQALFPGTSGPWNLYALSPNSQPATINVQGFGTDGLLVRTLVGTSWIDGENLDFVGTIGTTGFTGITSVSKPVTDGYVQLWATNGSDNLLLATYAPRETTPVFRCYYIPPHCWCNQPTNTRPVCVIVRARRRFVPLVNDTDVSPISNLPAMMAMIQAIQKREVSDFEGAMQYKETALSILRKEAISYLGPVKTPVITFAGGQSVGDYSYFR